MTTNRQITTLEISPAAPNRSIITGSVPTGHSGYKVSSAKTLQVRLNLMASKIHILMARTITMSTETGKSRKHWM